MPPSSGGHGSADLHLHQDFDPGRVKALLFDLGGVVIGLDFDRIFMRWAELVPCNVREISGRFSLDEAYERHERGEICATEYFVAPRGSLGISLSDEEFLTGWNDIYLDPILGMEEVLRVAGDPLPVYAFTNSNPSHQAVWNVRLQRELTHFRTVFVSSELGLRKPQVEAFSAVADRTGHRLSEFLFFHETLENVIEAKRAGMQSVGVRSIKDVFQALNILGVPGFEASKI